MLNVPSVESSVPDVFLTSIKNLSNCVVVVVSLDVMFSQNVRFGEQPAGMVIVSNSECELLLPPPRML